MKIIHIHTDPKFVSDSIRFENESFENVIKKKKKKEEYYGPYKEKALFYSTNLSDIKKIINICKKSDMVVLYDLNFIKCYIADHIPNNVIIIWRFFGLELYSKMTTYVFSELTLSIKYKKLPIYKKVLNLLRSILVQIKYCTNIDYQFDQAVKRVDYFAGLSDIEYDFLKQYWPDIPPFLQLSLSDYLVPYEGSIHKKNKVILGNNRSAFNNHFEILQLVKNFKNREKYEFLLFFNYGVNNAYSNTVREIAEKIPEVNVLEDFLPMSEFREIYNSVSAFVLNGHRQMAMANIFEAIRNSVKIYLNEKNVILSWLRKEGFLVFTIEDFVNDLESNNINLKESEILHNKKQLEVFAKKYTKEDFQNKILEIVTISKP